MRPYSYVERGFYAAQIRKVQERFPRESLLFLTSDDLRIGSAPFSAYPPFTHEVPDAIVNPGRP